MVTQYQHPTQSSLHDARGDAKDTLRSHMLTINLEDYFQVGVFKKFIAAEHWYRFESRLKRNVDAILELLDQHETKATFFVLGWIAEKEPELVREIADAGHEVASRGFIHQKLHRLSREKIQRDLKYSRMLLEDVTGVSVDGFRMSDGWLDRATLWLLDEIAEAGYAYDSSLLPNMREFKDGLNWRQIRSVETRSGSLFEVPLSVMELPGGWLPIAGGNYHRQVPDFVMRRLVERHISSGQAPFVMYFHTWELDREQPRLSVADRMTRLRHYRKLGKLTRTLPHYLNRYQFTSIRDYSKTAGSQLSGLIARTRTGGQPQLSDREQDVPVSPSPVTLQSGEFQRLTSSDSGQHALEVGEVTLVIPCYNEEKSLTYLANTLQSVRGRLNAQWRSQIIFVDDCSTDRTYSALNQLYSGDDSVQVIRHTENLGVSGAILTGLKHATTDIVASMDCDCSYDPHELEHMLPLMADDVAMVTASPYHRDGTVKNVPAWRLGLSRGLSWIYQRLLKQPLATWTSCFRVYRRDAILDLPLNETGFLGTAEMVAQLVLRERTVVEHPATLEVRLFGLSKMKTVRAICSHLRLLWRIARLPRGQRSLSND